jgi:long-chain fatty acid transport protein
VSAIRKCSFLLVSLLIVHGLTKGGGFQVNEMSARATGMGGVSAALTGDPTGVFVNPGALSFLSGTNLSLGSVVMLPDSRFAGPAPGTASTKMLSQVLFPPNVSLSHTFGSGFALGISADVPYQLLNEWDQDWVGSRLATKSELRAVFFSPSVAFKFSPTLSLGVSLNVVSTHLALTRRIGFAPPNDSSPDGTATIQGDSRLCYGAQIGVVFQPGSMLTLGGSFRSRSSIEFPDASESFTSVPTALQSSYPDRHVKTTFKLPEDVRIGVALSPCQWLQLASDLQYVRWSAFDRIQVRYADGNSPDISISQNWTDTFTFRFGIECSFSDLAIRGGIVVEHCPIPDEYLGPMFPDADRTGYSVGLGYTVGEGLVLDVAYVSFASVDRTITDSILNYRPNEAFNGTYSLAMNVLALNVRYTWNSQ